MKINLVTYKIVSDFGDFKIHDKKFNKNETFFIRYNISINKW